MKRYLLLIQLVAIILLIGCTGQAKNRLNHEKILSLQNYMSSPEVLWKVYEKKEAVKGVYVTAPVAGREDLMENLYYLAENTPVNAFVIDLKTDDGYITWKGFEQADNQGLSVNYIPSLRQITMQLYEKGIYPIARIVVFKDPLLPEKQPHLAIKNKDGSLWRDSKGSCWVNPYQKEVWDYIVAVAKQAAMAGFAEIQFDYIRFSDDSHLKDADFGIESQGISKAEIIAQFLQFAYDELEPYHVAISVDVFGAVITSNIDSKTIGQDYLKMAQIADVVCPMIYPSHYAIGSFGVKAPDLEPYKIVFHALEASNNRLSSLNTTYQVRPWLQAFTASWVTPYQKYGAEQIKQQIKACEDAGIEEWILWNSKSRYEQNYFENVV